MEKEKRAKEMIKVFSYLMKRAVNPEFTFPGGDAALRNVASCIETLESSGQLSDERLVDFCICQVYAVSRFGKEYLNRWNVSHSFGKKAQKRFADEKHEIRYFEDKWLKENKLNRKELCELIRDRSSHPQAKFIYPRYEDRTKGRLLGTVLGYYICGASTLLWTPFSPVCARCPKTSACEHRTRLLYPELYRIRVEEFNASGK